MKKTYILFFFISLSFALNAQELNRKKGELVVSLYSEYSASTFLKSIVKQQATAKWKIEGPFTTGFYILHFNEDKYSADKALQFIKEQKEVSSVEFNKIVHAEKRKNTTGRR
jgi:hypothetical protein